MKQGIVYTNDNCIGCNKCTKVCSAIGACVFTRENGRSHISVDGSKCVACGSCIDVCEHGAREFADDTERFFADLKAGRKISLLLAPSFRANYPDEYESVLGGLKDLGVNRIISVSFGADITTWGYLNYIKKYDFTGGISQPCPVVVSYIERYIPELIPKLFPVQSPLMCAAIYARKEMGITDRLAFISPCIAKKLEIEDHHNDGFVQYNVTFDHLMKYVREHGIKGDGARSEIEYGLGSFYPTPGGLAENVKWFLGDDVFIRQVEGEKHLYEWMHQNEERIKDNRTPFLFIDALNCSKGCICGTAVDPGRSKTDDSLYELLDIREESKKNESGSAWSRCDSCEDRLLHYNEQFKDLDLNDYLREYTDRSAECRYDEPDDEQLEEIFVSMNKLTEEDRNINCTCCGYESCRQMATAIHNGFNHRDNCIFYEKSMIQSLEVDKAVAEQATRAKSSFLANMSHEIRTPINAVLGMNEMVLRESDDRNIIAYSESIRSAGNTLLGLVNNILDFTKIESGTMDINPVEYDLSSAINDLVNMIQTRADDKGILMKLDFDPKIPKVLYGDEIRIKQVIANLLTNAVKYTEKGSVTFSVGYEDADDGHIDLIVRVVDTGIGIKSDDIERLFEKFDRIEESRNRNIEGTGLGMNITERLLELMDSHLEVKSSYGIGSDFSFRLRQKVVRYEELGDYQSAYQQLAGKRKTYHQKFTAPSADVLVIDDNLMNLMVFKSLLKQTLINIDTADSGDEGLSLAYDRKYDVIFFDHMMPDKDGIETLAELKAQKNNPNLDTPAICLTANAIAGAREEYLLAGFDDYISKPIDPETLEDLLMKYIPQEKLIRSHEFGSVKVSVISCGKNAVGPAIAKMLKKSGYDVQLHTGGFDRHHDDSSVTVIYVPPGTIDDGIEADIVEFASNAGANDAIIVIAADNAFRGRILPMIKGIGNTVWTSAPVDMKEIMSVIKENADPVKGKEEAFVEDDAEAESPESRLVHRILLVDPDPKRAHRIRDWIRDSYHVDVITNAALLDRFLSKTGKDEPVDLILSPSVYADMDTYDIRSITLDDPKTKEEVLDVINGKNNG